MIKREFMEGIGLNEEQITLLKEALDKENKVLSMLVKEKVYYPQLVLRTLDTVALDISNEALLREKIRIEYKDIIPVKDRKI